MIIQRWQAPERPTVQQMKMIFHSEGLEFKEEVFLPGSKLDRHRHPFDEVRMILQGGLIYNLSGNKILLNPGDRIEIPANTSHEMEVHGEQDCVSIMAFRLG